MESINVEEKKLVWIHGDCLSPNNPALALYPQSPAVFVFDDELLARYKLSLKRINFIYECLLDIPGIEIRKGEVATELAAAVSEHKASGIVTVDTVAPRFQKLVTSLRKQHRIPVEILELEPFIPGLDKDEEFDLKRFSRYWQAVSTRVLKL